ncbi:hypothetical protein DXG03_005268 [Asterophora parasitica]|uniref:Armadillo repeat-containing protein 8 n=1 Tax=Asterophora parasitica TaxID=117018 RepID=A0A9P7G6I3_9AGAR|nr:hypothetical protein DXG03_005268 [Asterophora parasitica]
MDLPAPQLTLSHLRKLKNSVIGNPSAKRALVRDPVFIQSLIECLSKSPVPTPTQSHEDIRIEAAHVIASLSYGSPPPLAPLLTPSAHAPRTLLRALALLTPADPPALRPALLRALRVLAAGIAEVASGRGAGGEGLGPWLGGGEGQGEVEGVEEWDLVEEARAGVEMIFSPEALDTLLPMLSPSPSPTSSSTQIQVQTTLAHLLASALLTPTHRRAVASWRLPSTSSDPSSLPIPIPSTPSSSSSAHPYPIPSTSTGTSTSPTTRRRGWETAVPKNKTREQRRLGCVPRTLVGLLKSRDVKLQEASLTALAAFARDTPDIATLLARPLVSSSSSTSASSTPSGAGSGGSTSAGPGEAPLSTVLALTKSRNTDVQLAACLWCVSLSCVSLSLFSHANSPPKPNSATHILRATSPTTSFSHSHSHSSHPTHTHTLPHFHYPNSTSPSHSGPQQEEEDTARTVIHIVNRVLEVNSGAGASVKQKSRACWVLYHLTTDAPTLSQHAFDLGCLARLLSVLLALPLPPALPREMRDLARVSVGEGEVLPGMPTSSTSLPSSSTGEGDMGTTTTRVYKPPLDLNGNGDVVMTDVGGAGGGGGGKGKDEEEWEWEEPEGFAGLREAALTAIASMSLFDNDIRRALTDPLSSGSLQPFITSSPASQPPTPPPFSSSSTTTTIPPTSASTTTTTTSITSPPTSASTTAANLGPDAPPLIPLLLFALAHPAPGVRCAACQCVRALTRAVAVLRTSIVDSGLGMGVWRVCVKGRGRSSKTTTAGGGKGEGKGKARNGASDSVLGPGQEEDGEEQGGAVGAVGRGGRGEEEDKRVLYAALAVLCNLLADFSPLRPVLLADGLLPRLREFLGPDSDSPGVGAGAVGAGVVTGEWAYPTSPPGGAAWTNEYPAAYTEPEFVGGGGAPYRVAVTHSRLEGDGDGGYGGPEDAPLRTNALWALKNLVCRSTGEVKRMVRREIGWGRVLRLTHDPNAQVREQAFHVLRNVAEDEEGARILLEPGPGGFEPGVLMERVAGALILGLRSPPGTIGGAGVAAAGAGEDVLVQAAYLLANISNGSDAHVEVILAHPQVLSALHGALTAAKHEPKYEHEHE